MLYPPTNYSPKFVLYVLDGAAREEHDTLALLVVEEVVERPQAARLAVRIRIEIRIVAVDVTVVQLDLFVDRGPKGLAQDLVLIAGDRRQIGVHRVHDPLQRRFLAKLVALRYIELVVKKSHKWIVKPK